MSKKYSSYLIEVAKWGAVIWLLLPLKNALTGQIDFLRVASGIVLFVIFSGKLLYDVVFFPRRHRAETSAGRDLVSMVGIVTVMALLVFLLVMFLAFYVINYMKTNAPLN